MKIKLQKKFFIILGILIVAIVAIVLGTIAINKYSYQKKYAKYGDKILTFGLNGYYSDEKAKEYKNVKNGEALAIIGAAALNTEDAVDLGYAPTFTHKNASWVRYAEVEKIIKEASVDAKNVNKEISKIEVVRILGKYKEEILKKDLNTDVKLKINQAHKLDKKDQEYLKDAVKNGLFKNSGSIKDTVKIKRGEFNKAVHEFMVTTDCIASGLGEVETNAAKLPSNSEEFPYILKGYDKAIYEVPFKKDPNQLYAAEFQNPNKLYEYIRGIEKSTTETVTKYFDLLLNVDYKNIDSKQLLDSYTELMQFTMNKEIVEPYVNYVKEHKLVLSGESKVFSPAMYYDGNTYRMRVQITLNVLEGDTKDNVLLGDTLGAKVTYSGNNTYVVDMPMEYGITSPIMYMSFVNIAQNIVK
ncbi:MAG: hypothetical protein RR988_03455 [Clostridia bacterium]